MPRIAALRRQQDKDVELENPALPPGHTPSRQNRRSVTMQIVSWFQRFGRRSDERRRPRVIGVLGMHRSGTSAVTRGLQALGVYLGNEFLDAQPENPTGYWEDKGMVELNERALKALALKWDDFTPVDPANFDSRALRKLRRAAIGYVRRAFGRHPLWGFKDPRTIRVLPFWLEVFATCGLDDAYLLVIRNPMSVAKSLFARQQMPLEDSLRLWLAYSVPFFARIAGKPLLVVDYDRFMLEPRQELGRIASGIGIDGSPEGTGRDLDRFAREFLDERLRHTLFSIADIDRATPVGRLTRDAYELLLDLACDRTHADAKFWTAWQRIADRYASNVAGGAEGLRHG
jgi:O-antigen biosynthesis protein